MSASTTEFGFSYEYGVDIWDGSNWLPIRFISAVAPSVTPVTADAATYDDKGAPNEVKLSESWSLAFTIQQHRNQDGSYLDEVEALLDLAAPDATGESATGKFRWYDKPAVGDPNSDDAYEGFASVQIDRGQTDNNTIGGWAVTLTGRGRRTRITNPYTGESSSS